MQYVFSLKFETNRKFPNLNPEEILQKLLRDEQKEFEMTTIRTGKDFSESELKEFDELFDESFDESFDEYFKDM